MADLAFGLAKTVVEGILSKAQTAIEQEAKLRQNLVFITGEFEMMNSFFKVAKVERVENEVVRTWVRQVRELAYDVEDSIEFVVHLESNTSWWFPLIHPFRAMRPLPRDEAVDLIEQLKARMEEVSTRNARFNLMSDTGFNHILQQQEMAVPGDGTAVAANTFDMLVEARGCRMRWEGLGNLTQLIIDEDDTLKVISLWGAGGDHGTTSILRKTYNQQQICQNFTYRAWLKLMHPFNPRNFVRSLMAQFYAKSCGNKKVTVGIHVLRKMEATQEALFKEFDWLVTHKRYLIVLEDLSSISEWDAIRTFFPPTNNGSCIVVSAMQSEIASLCIGHSYQILELKKFSDQHSVCALFKGSQRDGDNGNITMGSDGEENYFFNYFLKKIRRINEVQITPMTSQEIRAGKIRELEDRANEWRENNYPLIGREQQMNELAEYSSKARVNSPPVMSVWGIAGVGKSALVKNLFYDRVLSCTNQYEEFYWVDVSHPFNLRDLYLTLLPNFHSEIDHMDECHNLLNKSKCLIVIDDIRSIKEWDLIQPALVSKHSMSVIIVITTEASIATYCTNTEDLVYNVKALEAHSSIDLFKQQVYDTNPAFPLLHQDEQVDELIFKCGGLPKVIVAVTDSLAKDAEIMHTIPSLNSRFMHHMESNPDYDNLQDLFGWMHSYFRTCPDSLKPCIFYLSIFPQDQIIRRRRLVRRWIAEGYSIDGHNESAEDMGEEQFLKLLDLSIIQQPSHEVSTAYSNTRMVLCQVNGFIREYIVSQRMEENLVFELGGKCSLTTKRMGRHLIILKSWNRDMIVFKRIDFSRLRSLTVFGKWESFFVSESMKMLRVLDLEDALVLTHADVENMVKMLRRLKFLSLRGHGELRQLPNSLGDLRHLQTVDIRGTSIVTFPVSIIKLVNIQYIRAGSTVQASKPPISSNWLLDFFGHHRLVGVEVPIGIGRLTGLHTVGVINVSSSGGKTVLEDLKKLTQLRKLGVSGINMSNIQKFFQAISSHSHLESFSMQLEGHNGNSFGYIHLPWENLQSLKLYGLENNLPVDMVRLCKLTKLYLEMDELTQIGTEILARLPKLCILRLAVKQPSLRFAVQLFGVEEKSYENVKIIEIAGRSTSLHVTFGLETMRKLEVLKVDCSSGMTGYRFTGMNGLYGLKEVLLKGTNLEQFRTDLQNQLDSEHPKKPAVKLQGH
ncbi:unnamed protein product [Alopecurus aequalis]